MNNKITELVWKPYNAEILNLCDGTNSISTIQKEIGFTYKSILDRLDMLKTEGLIIKNNEPHTASFPKVSDKHRKEVMQNVTIILESNRTINKKLTEPNNKKIINKILTTLDSNRHIDRTALLSKFKLEDDDAFITLLPKLIDSCYIKERFELTKKGKNSLRRIQNE